MSTPKPFTLRVSDDDMADLRARLGRTRFPDQAPGQALGLRRQSGISSRPVSYWRDRFDWHAQETKLNGFPQFIASSQKNFRLQADLPLHGSTSTIWMWRGRDRTQSPCC
jgi:hypothetical protein